MNAQNTLLASHAFVMAKWDLQAELHRNPSNPRREYGQVPTAPSLASGETVAQVGQRQWWNSSGNSRFWVEHAVGLVADCVWHCMHSNHKPRTQKYTQTPPYTHSAQAKTNKTPSTCMPSSRVSVLPGFLQSAQRQDAKSQLWIFLVGPSLKRGFCNSYLRTARTRAPEVTLELNWASWRKETVCLC